MRARELVPVVSEWTGEDLEAFEESRMGPAGLGLLLMWSNLETASRR